MQVSVSWSVDKAIAPRKPLLFFLMMRGLIFTARPIAAAPPFWRVGDAVAYAEEEQVLYRSVEKSVYVRRRISFEKFVDCQTCTCVSQKIFLASNNEQSKLASLCRNQCRGKKYFFLILLYVCSCYYYWWREMMIILRTMYMKRLHANM